MKTLRLGLIGGNITESRSPALQIVCGLSVGINVSYDLLIPKEQGLTFEAMLQRCKAAGFDGVNVTYPFKEDVLKYIAAAEPVVSHIGASNTVVFEDNGAKAWNTDYTGFIAAYSARFADQNPGRVLMIGTGGVGRAVAFALKALNAAEIVLHDIAADKAEKLAAEVGGTLIAAEQLSALHDFDGVINCTPLGMTGREGSPLPQSVRCKPKWAFDAVYTPTHTIFRAQMEKSGADFLSGYELYFNQGIQGFEKFSGHNVSDEKWVRKVLAGQV